MLKFFIFVILFQNILWSVIDKKNCTPLYRINKKDICKKDLPMKYQQMIWEENHDVIITYLYSQYIEKFKKEGKNVDFNSVFFYKKFLNYLDKNFDDLQPLFEIIDIKSLEIPYSGNEKSKIEFFIFADWHCKHCKEAFKNLEEISEMEIKIGNKKQKIKNLIKYYHMDFFLTKKSKEISKASICAYRQGKYSLFHKKAYEMIEKNKKYKDVEILIKSINKSINLDEKKFEICIKDKDGSIKKIIKFLEQTSDRLGVSATPTIFVNNRKKNKSYKFMRRLNKFFVIAEIKKHL